MLLWILFAAVAVAATARTIFMDSRTASHLRYLQREVHALGGEDRWNVRCSHCGKRMRDAASIRLSTRSPAGSGWVERTDGVFHLGRPDCAAAADELGESR